MANTTINSYILNLQQISCIDIGAPSKSISVPELQALIWAKHRPALAYLRNVHAASLQGGDPLQPSDVFTLETPSPGGMMIHLVVAIPGIPGKYDPLYARMQSFHRRWWGNPLDAALTTLPAARVYDDDESEDGDEEDEPLPGDPFLEVDDETKLLVRAEHLRVFDMVMAVYDRDDTHEMAVVTGHPGIGTTWWIYYALRRCLGAERSVLWYKEDTFYWFSPSGVFFDRKPSGRKSTWCFVDAADTPALPREVCHDELPYFPVYVTDPQQSRWQGLGGTGRHPAVVVMNPWTWPEMEKAAQLFPPSMNAIPDVRARFDRAGPVVRHCLLHDPRVPGALYARRAAALGRWVRSAAAYERLLADGMQLRLADGAATLCLVRRARDPDAGWAHRVDVVTEGVRREIRDAMWAWPEGELERSFRRLYGARRERGS